MVSFSCEECGDILTKKKLDPHRSRCRGATFTCIDCMVHFPGTDYRSHTSCMTEDQKYQGALYKEKNKKPAKQHTNPEQHDSNKKMRGQQAFVEDVRDDYSVWDGYEGQTNDERSPAELLPEAPTPPSAANEDHINVFDFMVATGQTPNASTMNLDHQAAEGESTSLVRYEPKDEDDLDPAAYMEEDDVQYGSGPVPVGKYATPLSKSERRKSKDADGKKDKKRKRLHLDVPADRVMTDAPPVLHSGLTGGLKSLMRPTLPPSPDYSGGDVAEPSTTTKKSKHSKPSKHSQSGNTLFGMLSNSTKTKSKKRKTSKKSSDRHKEDKAANLIEYRPHSRGSQDGKANGDDGQMIVYKPRADVFLSFINKGPESERGCSMNKALKRFHREREASGSNKGKSKEEKELWRSLRMKRNERGEIVLFSEDFDLDQVL